MQPKTDSMLTRITLPEVEPKLTLPKGTISDDLSERFGASIVANSPIPERHVSFYRGANGFMDAVHKAWARHLPLRIRPDDIWLLILQGICIQVNQRPEHYRERLVYHKKKLTLEAATLAPVSMLGAAGWQDMIHDHTQQARELCTPLARQLMPTFSTTTPVEETAFMATFLHLLKEYFHYTSSFICGIPAFLLEGTADDYRLMMGKLELLAEFDLQDWGEELKPLLQQFLNAKDGQPDLDFWRQVYQRETTYKQLLIDCDYVNIEYNTITGHFVSLFPFLHLPANDSKHQYFRRTSPQMDFSQFPYSLTSYPVHCLEEGVNSTYTVYSGFLGCQVCRETYTVSPQIGWVVTRAAAPRQKA